MASQRDDPVFSAGEEDSSPAPVFSEAPVFPEVPFPSSESSEFIERSDGVAQPTHRTTFAADQADDWRPQPRPIAPRLAAAGPGGIRAAMPADHHQNGPLGSDIIAEAVRALISPELLNETLRSVLTELIPPSSGVFPQTKPPTAPSSSRPPWAIPAPAPPLRASASQAQDNSDSDSDDSDSDYRPRSSAAKPMPPPVFSGNRQVDRVDADGFICQCEIYFSLATLPQDSRVLTAVSRLSGTALSWWRGNRRTISGLDSRWETFSSHFIAEFRATDEAREARTALYATRERRLGVPALIAEFTRQIPRVPDITDGELLHLFLHSLPPNVSPYVLTQRPASFTDAKRLANLAHSALPMQPRRPFRPPFPQGGAPPQQGAGQPPRQHPFPPRAGVAAVHSADGLAEHEAPDAGVAAVHVPRPPRLTPEERQRLIDIGACFRCRQPGHQAPNCPVFGHLGNGPRRD